MLIAKETAVLQRIEHMVSLGKFATYLGIIVGVGGHSHHSHHSHVRHGGEFAAIGQLSYFLERKAEFCLLLSHMYLQQHIHRASYTLGFFIDAVEQSLGVDAMYQAHVGQQCSHLIGLQMAYEMPLHIGRHFLRLLHQLLHPTLAEDALPCRIGFHQFFHRMEFRHSHQSDICRQFVGKPYYF